VTARRCFHRHPHPERTRRGVSIASGFPAPRLYNEYRGKLGQDDLPNPEVLAQGIADDLEAALEKFSIIVEKLKG